jgi:hypothetical protein
MKYWEGCARCRENDASRADMREVIRYVLQPDWASDSDRIAYLRAWFMGETMREVLIRQDDRDQSSKNG